MIDHKRLGAMAIAGLVAASFNGQANGEPKYENVKRVIVTKTFTRDAKPILFTQVTFGDWLAGCEAELKKSDNLAKCVLTQASGRMAEGFAQPLDNGVSIELTSIRQPQFEIYLASHAKKSDYGVSCGAAKFSSDNYRLRKFYLEEAGKYIAGLKANGCKVHFTPKDKDEAQVQVITQRGFGDVLAFAKDFIAKRE